MSFSDYISVVMPAYNSSEFITTAIQSILNQTYSKFELIIVNDGSSDNTGEIINSISDERIKYYKIEHSGMGAALNFGMKNAKYDWVALMDSDDIAHPERFMSELNCKKLERNDVLFPDSVYFLGVKIKFLNSVSGDFLEVKEKIRLHGHICMSGVIFNRDFILANGGFDEILGDSEDYDLWMRIIDTANFIHVNKFLMFVRLRENSLSRDNQKKTKDTIYSIKQKYNINYPGLTAGWNEFFYGSRLKARNVFKKYLFNPRAAVAYLLTFIPETLFISIVDNKVIPKLRYSVYKIIFFPKHLKQQNELRAILKSFVILKE